MLHEGRARSQIASRLAVLLLVAFAVWSPGRSRGEVQTETSKTSSASRDAGKTFLRAHHESGLIGPEEPSDLVLFEEPTMVVWSTLAPLELVELQLPDIQRIYGAQAGVREYCRCAKVEYSAPLSEDVAGMTCQLLAPGGVFPLTLIGLRGTVVLDLGDDSTIVARSHYGRVVAERSGTDGPDAAGGFVVCSRDGAVIGTAEGSVDVADLVQSTAEKEEKHEVLMADASDAEEAFWTIASQYVFELQGSKLVFIAWRPDEGMYELGCVFRYSIARLDELPEIVASNDYGCDI